MKLKKHDRIMWFADYRDEWTTFQNKSSLPLANKLTNIFHRQFEKNGHPIVTVSSRFQKIGFTIYSKNH